MVFVVVVKRREEKRKEEKEEKRREEKRREGKGRKSKSSKSKKLRQSHSETTQHPSRRERSIQAQAKNRKETKRPTKLKMYRG